MKIFASSDHHFYHKNIIKYVNRPFDVNHEDCVIDNAKLMIHRHNEIVSNGDVAIFVGDLSAGLRGRDAHYHGLLQLLNGKKILVRGNHDRLPDDFYLSAGFLDVLDYIEIDEYFISHYPCYESRWIHENEKEHLRIVNRDHCKVIIHGHIHNKDPALWEPDGITRINVCVDYEPNNYYPVQLTDDKIVNYFSKYK